jgi:hypothetical protein
MEDLSSPNNSHMKPVNLTSAFGEEFQLTDMRVGQMVESHMAEHISRTSSDSVELNSFLSSHARVVNEKGADYNLIDQHNCKKLLIHENGMSTLFQICEKMRLNGVNHGLSQRQCGDARIFLDFDIFLMTNTAVSSDGNVHRGIMQFVIPFIMKDMVSANNGDIDIYVTFAARTTTSFSSEKAVYKDGIHMYLSIWTPQSYRKHLVDRLRANKQAMKRAFHSVRDNIHDLSELPDGGSATVPPLFIGGTKRGGTPYKVCSIYKACFSYDNNQVFAMDKLKEEEYVDWNITATFSPKYIPDKPEILHRPRISPSLEKELSEINAKVFEEMEFKEVEDISILNLNDPKARELTKILALLATTRADNYASWMKILLALARYGDRYKPIARMFSMHSTTKYEAITFETQWKKSLTKCIDYPGCCVGMIYKMAQVDDPSMYKQLTNEFLTQKILRDIFEVMGFMDSKTASLGEYQIADIIYTAFPNKYISVPKRTSSGRRMADDSDVIYYSLITPKSPEYRPGMAYKYDELMSTAPMNIYLSKKMPVILKQVQRYFRTKRDSPNQAEQETAKYSIGLGIIGKAYHACQMHKSKMNIMRQFAYLTTSFQFEKEMDAHPYVIGVWDALLVTGVTPMRIQDVCEYKVTRTSPSMYILFDPQEKMIIKVAQMYLDFSLFDKFDKTLYVMIFQCQALSRTIKQLVLLNLWGHGSNSKSTIILFLLSALGTIQENGYAYRMTMDYLTKPRSNSSAAQSELMALKHATYTIMSELGADESIIETKWKSLMSGEVISARELYGTEDNFVPTCAFICGSNRKLKFNDGGPKSRRYAFDHGFTRRLKVCQAEKTFTSRPDPSNPSEQQADPKILSHVIPNKEYGGALLSLLSVVHSLFITIHDEQMLYVCSPNIDKETEEHINTFDTISCFINKNCVRGEKIEIKLDTVIDMYIAWHDKEYTPVTHSRDRIRSAFLMSKIDKSIKLRDSVYWVVGIRALAIGEKVGENETRIRASNEFEFKSYEDYTVPHNSKLPFDGRIKKTRDAKEFLAQLADLHKEEQAKWFSTHDRSEIFPSTNAPG